MARAASVRLLLGERGGRGEGRRLLALRGGSFPFLRAGPGPSPGWGGGAAVAWAWLARSPDGPRAGPEVGSPASQLPSRQAPLRQRPLGGRPACLPACLSGRPRRGWGPWQAQRAEPKAVGGRTRAAFATRMRGQSVSFPAGPESSGRRLRASCRPREVLRGAPSAGGLCRRPLLASLPFEAPLAGLSSGVRLPGAALPCGGAGEGPWRACGPAPGGGARGRGWAPA